MTLVPASSGDGGAVSMRGPFSVTYQTPDLANPAGTGALVGPVLAEGSVILAAWLATTTEWQADTSVDEGYVLTSPGDVELWGLFTAAPLARVPIRTMLGAFPTPIYLRSGSCQLQVVVYATNNLTAGAGDVYALIAEP